MMINAGWYQSSSRLIEFLEINYLLTNPDSYLD